MSAATLATYGEATSMQLAQSHMNETTLLPDARQIARQRMLNDNIGLVHFVARQVARGMRIDLEFDELISAGTLGLMAAADAFDPSRGLAFSTFATPRIRGAMLDELRRQDHVPRSIRRKGRDLKTAREALNRAGNTEPTDRETAQQLGVDIETLWQWQSDVETSVRIPLDDTPSDDGAPTQAEMLAGVCEDDIEDRVTHSQEVDHLRDAIMTLKEQERIVLSLYYYEDLKLHEIAMALGITESRVSQIRTKALGNLRTKMAHLRAPIR
ncbi:MAG TPA: FliA/WhiG family RNA polymerase sigma factor [Gemmatimonadaceae bacterium]|nr:FliA/WhiG family RNA polymerase sigma factor [Gemmatimonadaceae bacterium]